MRFIEGIIIMLMTETQMKVGDTLLFCEVYEKRDESGGRELRYRHKEAGVITKISPRRVYFKPAPDDKWFKKGYADGKLHAEVDLPRSETENISLRHLTYYASSGENLEKYALRAANILRERARREVREAAEELKQLLKPVKGIEATMIGGAGEMK